MSIAYRRDVYVLAHPNKKLIYCWQSSGYNKFSGNGRSANTNHNPKSDLCKFYFTKRVVGTWNSIPS